MQSSDPTSPRFYGRRKGRPLRRGMQALLTDMLPGLRFDATRPIAAQFGQALTHQADLALEIGFGGGEHLAGLAEANPAVNFIGAEPFLNGVASLLRHMQTRHLSNILIWDDDVRLILPALPVAGVSHVFIMFPDPWPKKRHAGRRILQPEMMDVLAKLIRPTGQLVLASDDPTAKSWLLRTAISHPQFCWTALRPGDWRQRPPHLPATRYMAKAEQASRQPSWFIFERRR
ncbi:MAG: tRNA (guanine(46)-N(7))-methyltransferase TrmB [Pseudomonadota bacterium]|nr:tRNA (guanine(46)-N(7))-methyltransferase TrmB [Pseudomonadota bacterium]